jgi:hypothetical protein
MSRLHPAARRFVLAALSLLAVPAATGACGGGGGNEPGGGPDLPDVPYVREDAADDGAAGGTEGTGGNRPPVLAKVGDRVIGVGETLAVTLSASDPDGDDLTYSVYGDVPDGAKFDKAAHTLTWVPLKAGVKVFLTFVVSDGDAIDRETVEIKVVAERTGHPPVFEKVSDQKIAAGKAFSLQLQAHDPDADALAFAIVGQPPAGATLGKSTGLFQWTPPQSLDGQVVTIGFEVADPGKLKDSMDVRFLVGDAQAGSPPTLDPLPEQVATPGEEVSFRVTASDPDGDQVTIAAEAGMPDGSSFEPEDGRFRWTPAASDAGRVVEVTFSAYDGKLKSFGDVRIVVEKPSSSCEPDSKEPNDSPEAAKAVSAGDYDLSICDTAETPEDWDFFVVQLAQGETISVEVAFEHDNGDLDCDLSRDGTAETILAFSNGTSDEEHFSYTAEQTRDYVIAVYGVGGEKYASPYHLSIRVEATAPACEDDPLEENDSAGEALPLTPPSDLVPDLVACPGDADWFSIDLAKGESLVVGATPKGSAKVRLEVLEPDGGSVADSAGPSSGPLTAAVEGVDEAGAWYVRVTADADADYSLEVLVEAAPAAGCDSKSCSPIEVCDAATGECVTDWCEAPTDCPDGLACIDTYCVDPCTSDADCRDGYACKSFPDGRFCGHAGGKPSGAPCAYFSECGADRACLFPGKGGYCAVWGCTTDLDCPLDSWCHPGDGGSWCAAECQSDADCALSAGFACKPGQSADGLDVTVCL